MLALIEIRVPASRADALAQRIRAYAHGDMATWPGFARSLICRPPTGLLNAAH